MRCEPVQHDHYVSSGNFHFQQSSLDEVHSPISVCIPNVIRLKKWLRKHLLVTRDTALRTKVKRLQ